MVMIKVDFHGYENLDVGFLSCKFLNCFQQGFPRLMHITVCTLLVYTSRFDPLFLAMKGHGSF